METTVKKLIEKLSKYNPNDKVEGTISIIINLDDTESPTESSEQIKTLPIKSNNSRFVLTDNIQMIVNWKMDANAERKINNFVDTLLSHWNPFEDISTLRNSYLNSTTLSKALFEYAIKNKKGFNTVDTLINELILTNINYIRNKYVEKNGNKA